MPNTGTPMPAQTDRRAVLLDCDPGIDDAMALALLVAEPTVELVAVTTVTGNVPLVQTTANALRLAELFGSPGLRVVAGASTPLLRPAVDARHVHGVDGLGGAPVPGPARRADGGFGPDEIVRILSERPGEVDLVAVGPMTNLALALRREPRITEWARSVVLMGGGYTRGNITPAAEFNFFADPEAAAVVFDAPWQPVLVSLDLTLQARVTSEIMQRWSAYGALSELLLIPALGNYFDSRSLISDDDGQRDPTITSAAPAIHDACAAAYVIAPELFRAVPALTRVETQGRYTAGMSVVDFRVPDAPALGPAPYDGSHANSVIATEIDLDGFWDLMSGAFETIATRVRSLAQPGDQASAG